MTLLFATQLIYQPLPAHVVENSQSKVLATLNFESIKSFTTRPTPFDVYKITHPLDNGEWRKESALPMAGGYWNSKTSGLWNIAAGARRRTVDHTCGFPAGATINRAVDLPLTVSRLPMWMCDKGFLHWGYLLHNQEVLSYRVEKEKPRDIFRWQTSLVQCAQRAGRLWHESKPTAVLSTIIIPVDYSMKGTSAAAGKIRMTEATTFILLAFFKTDRIPKQNKTPPHHKNEAAA